MQSKRRPTPKCWYIDMGVGINTICKTVNRLCELTSIKDGNFKNQSCHATSITRLVRNDQDSKVVKSISGHRSNVVGRYKHVSDKQKRKASAILQNRAETVSKPVKTNDENSVATKKTSNNSDLDDFEIPVTLKKSPLTPVAKCEHCHDVKGTPETVLGELMNVVKSKKYKKMNVVKSKKYKKVRFNVELDGYD